MRKTLVTTYHSVELLSTATIFISSATPRTADHSMEYVVLQRVNLPTACLQPDKLIRTEGGGGCEAQGLPGTEALLRCVDIV